MPAVSFPPHAKRVVQQRLAREGVPCPRPASVRHTVLRNEERLSMPGGLRSIVNFGSADRKRPVMRCGLLLRSAEVGASIRGHEAQRPTGK